MADETATLKTMYACFNARDIDGVLAMLADDVEWANGMDGGHEHGQDAVRAYWTRQWAEVSPRVEPLRIVRRDDGRIDAEVRLELFDLAGEPLAAFGGLNSHILHHVYRFADGKVARFDIEDA